MDIAWTIGAGGAAETQGVFWFAWYLWFAQGIPRAQSQTAYS